MTTSTKPAAEDICVNVFTSDSEVRAINEEKRTATFVVATENGVDEYDGKEYLRVKGMDLTRYRKNPVVVDVHNIWESGAVIGRSVIKREGTLLVAEVEFAETERAEEIWTLVRTGFLRATSVRFKRREVLRLQEGETNGRGAARVEGPANIILRSELIELSIVPVPADEDTLRRSAQWFLKTYKENTMPSEREVPAPEGTTPPVESNEPDATRTVPPAPAPAAAPVPLTMELLSAPAPESEAESCARQIRALAPRGLEALADDCILRGLGLEDARKELLAAHKAGLKPVGTPDAEAGVAAEGDDAPPKIDDLNETEFTRSICGI